MNIIATSDWHLRLSSPRFRKDNFFQTQLDKLKFILDLARKHKALILMGGDFFDQAFPSYKILLPLIDLFSSYKDVKIFAIYGQHDLGYHALKDTALGLLGKIGLLTLVNDMINLDDKVVIHGCNFDQEIPKPIKNKFNILMIHKMIINDKKLWKDQEDFVYAKNLLKLGFDLVVSGDNHSSFITKYRNKVLVNSGSLMRLTSAQLDHKPMVALFDSNSRKYEKILIPIKPVDEVFDMESLDRTKEISSELSNFIMGLEQNSELQGLDFIKNIKQGINESMLDDLTKNYIWRMVNGK